MPAAPANPLIPSFQSLEESWCAGYHVSPALYTRVHNEGRACLTPWNFAGGRLFRKPNNSRRRGIVSAFTLMELLIVIGVIAALLAILLPSLANAKHTARQVVCASNLRQWGIAVRVYSQIYDGWLPRRGQGVNPTQQIDRPTDWFNALPPLMNAQPYVALAAAGQVPRPRDNSIFSCGEATDDGQPNFWSYAMNMWLSVWNNGTDDLPDKFDAVGPPDTMVFLADGPADYCSVSPAPSPQYAYSPVARHLGKVNIGFLDGHAQAFSAAYIGCGIGFVEHDDVHWRVPGSAWQSAQH